MRLLNCQNKIVKDLYNKIINNNDILAINVIGEIGSGKTTIIEGLLDTLKEGWSVHYINGCSEKVRPSSQIETKKRREFFPIPSLSIKLSCISLGCSFRFQEVDTIFNDIEKQFVKEINLCPDNSLIIIYNYQYLDEYTKQFVNTIIKKRISLFKKKNPVFILTSDSKISGDFIEINVKNLCSNDVQELLKNINIEKKYDINKLIKITNGNIKFISNLISYDMDIDNSSELSTIIQKRIKQISNKISTIDYQTIENICIYGSYFLKGFTLMQIAKIHDRDIDDETFYKIFCGLSNLGLFEENNNIIDFTLDKFKLLIKQKSFNYERFYFSKFYDFYSKYYDNLYDTRLKYAVELYKYNEDIKLKSKIIGLYFTECINKIYGRTLTDIKYLNEWKENLLFNFPEELYHILVKIVKKEIVLDDIKDINLLNFDILIQIEINIIKLNIFNYELDSTQISNNYLIDAIKIVNKEKKEIEKYALLRLQTSIISQLKNRSCLNDIFDDQYKLYEEMINEYIDIDCDIYYQFLNVKNRKSGLYENIDESICHLQDSISYFNKINNIYELYYSYVNLLGMFVVANDYNKANKTIIEIENLFNNNDIYFDKKYKYLNNKLLVELKMEKEKNKYIDTIKKYACLFYSLYDNYKSKVIRLNYCSLLAQLDIDKALKEINNFLIDNGNTYNFDPFYTFYLNNLKILIFIIKKDWLQAESMLQYLGKIIYPSYNNTKEYNLKRIEAFKLIIKNKIEYKTIEEYDDIIYNVLSNLSINHEYYNGKDDSWYFYSRAFILSDLQYFD